MLEPDERWICVQAHAHKERLAAENLRRQNYRCFMPAVLRQIRHARQTRTELRPFFPRYLFVVLDPARQQWRPIRNTFGVSGLIMGDESPKLVPEGVVEALINATDQLGSLDFRDNLAVGQSVRLLTGPFADFIGSLERLDANGRVAVLLEIMGGQRRVVTERVALQALST